MLTGLLISLFAAMIPTLIHTMIFYWADRYEREPRWLLTVAFLWGAIPAIIASIIAEVALAVPIASSAETLNGQIVESSIHCTSGRGILQGFCVVGNLYLEAAGVRRCARWLALRCTDRLWLCHD